MSGPSGVSFAYPAVPGDQRARLALGGPALREAYRRLAAVGEGAFLLSTCLRVEVAVLGDRSRLEQVLRTVWANQALPAGGALREGEEQVLHLFRVAAGVESPILGEPEVLGQFRKALEAGRREGAVDGLFERLLGEAVSVGREVRRLLPDSPHGSLARVAAQLVAGASQVAVLGAGEMARAVVEALAGSPARITMYSRRPPTAGVGAAEFRSVESVIEALASAPAVVSATSAKRALFSPEELEQALRGRSDELLLVDLAMPPDFQPSAGMPHLKYVGVDRLAGLARPSHLPAEVVDYLQAAADSAAARLANHPRAGPVIAAILERARRVVEEEVDRFGSRLGEADGAASLLAHRVVRRVLHEPISFLSTHDRGGETAGLMAEAFGVADDD